MIKYCLAAGIVLLGLSLHQTSAQLAITETLSSASTNLGPTQVAQGPDFWELTNFGTNSIDLSGYRFNDADATLGGDADVTTLNGVTIGPGESIVLVQLSGGTGITNRDDFTNWWGAVNVPTNLQVLFYTGNGQSSAGDSIVLWNATTTSDADYVDRVDFGEATRGRSFTYNTNTSVHGILSTNGIRGAFKAVTSDDEGSPGITTGPVTLGFTQNPTPSSQSVPAGQNATFSAAAKGLPHPHYQWRFQGVPIPEAILPSLTITNAQLTNAGQYTVVITNGLMALTSSVATLTVTTGPLSPGFTILPKDADAFVNQTVQFSVVVSGSPTPALQWRSNNVDLTGETATSLTLFNVQSNQAAAYSVVASSSAGTNSASANLAVTAKPRLLITEVHSTGSTGFQDWWELTSFESYPINLKGWRWDDSSASLAAGNAFVFTNDIIIHPGESMVFVENLTVAQFRGWWTNLPSSLKIIPYAGGGLGLSSTADAVNVWNGVTLVGNELTERIAGVNFAACPVGVTFVYDPENPPVGGVMSTFSTNTVNGTVANGMLTASNGSIGSPGRVTAPILVTNSVTGGNSLLSWNAANNRNYTVEFKSDLAAPNWTAVSNLTATGASAVISEPANGGQRYYRVGAGIPFIAQP